MPRRILQGVVVSDKSDKTIIVNVERRVMHPIYKKVVRRSKKYAAHDAENRCKVGDTGPKALGGLLIHRVALSRKERGHNDDGRRVRHGSRLHYCTLIFAARMMSP